DGLIGVQNARATLAQAIADRGPLPQRFTEDPVKTALLIAASETLDGFASGLTEITPDGVSASLPSAARIEGTLDWPVNGTLLRQFREADAAGVARPGLILATRANALVTSPAAATVRFQGDLLDYGNVMILEPARDVLVVLAGLEDVYVSTGDVVTTGAPIGLMGGTAPDAASGVSERTQTLYIEIRDDQEPVDPAGWFTTRGN
ncbi:MAG: peptidoglycan DD-metalloendopeptidase family protein, partial [Pseudomonadota bacterium]